MSYPNTGYTRSSQVAVFKDPPNLFGESPAHTWSQNSGPLLITDKETGIKSLDAKASKDKALAAYFGQNTKPDIPNPYDSYDIENYQLPDGFTGSRPYVRHIILRKIAESDQFPFREMCPIKQNDNSLEIHWDCWMFNDHMLGRVPEESVSRLLSSNVTGSSESMVRWGIALMLEHGFYKTERGKLNYRMNIEQISNAVATTLAYGAMYACLNAHYTDKNNKYRRVQQRGLNDIKKLFQEELDNWSIIQKTEGGWKVIFEKCKKALYERNQKPGNYTVVPAGTRKYLEGRPENNYFVYNGITGGQRADVMPYDGALRESVGYRVGEHEPNDDVTIRERTIGGFFHLLPGHLEDVESSEYRTHMMDTDIFCEDKDDYHTVRYRTAIEKTGLFDTTKENWELTEKVGKPYFEAFGDTWGMFLKKSGRLDIVVKHIVAKCVGVSDTTFRLAFIEVAKKGLGSNVPLGSTSTSTSSGSGSSGSTNKSIFGTGVTTTDVSTQVGSNAQALSLLTNWSIPHVITITSLKNLDPNEFTTTDETDVANSVNHVLDDIRKGDKKDLNRYMSTSDTTIEELNKFLVLLSTDSSSSSSASSSAPPSGPVIPKSYYSTAKSSTPVDNLKNLSKMIVQTLLLLVYYGANSGHGGITLRTNGIGEVVFDYGTDETGISGYHSTLRRFLPSSEVDVIFEEHKGKPLESFIRAFVDESFLYDLRHALESTPRTELTSFEKETLDKQTYTETVSEDVEKSQPIWTLNGEQVEISMPFLLDQPSAQKTTFKSSDALTLSSDSLVLFTLSGSQVRELGKPGNFGLITVSNRNLIPPFGRYRRLAKLQFSVTLSAVYHKLVEYVSVFNTLGGSKARASDKPLTDLVTDIASLVPSKLPGYDIDGLFASTIIESAKTHPTTFTPALFQYRLSNIIVVVRDFLFKFIKHRPNLSDKENMMKFKATVVELLSYTENHLFHHNFKKAVSALPLLVDVRHSHWFPYTDALLSGKSISLDEKKKLRDEAINTTAAFYQAVSANKNQTQKDFIDRVFAWFGNDLLALYEYLYSKHQRSSPDYKERYRRTLMFATMIPDNTNEENHYISGVRVFIYLMMNMYGVGTASNFNVNSSAKASDVFDEIRSKVKFFIKHTDPGSVLKEMRGAISKEVVDKIADYMRDLRQVERGNSFADITTYTRLKNTPESTQASNDPQPPITLTTDEEKNEFYTIGRITDILYNLSIEDGSFVRFLLDNHGPAIIGILGFRPFKRYDMGTMLHMNGYGEAANTWYGHADFQLSDNVAQKMHYGHFTMYAKTVVQKPEMIVRGDNIVVVNYNGGNGTRSWDPSNMEHVEAFDNNELIADIFYIPVPANFEVTSHFMDITGRFSSRLSANSEAQAATYYGPAADIIPNIFGWRATPSQFTREHFSSISPRFNTLVFQEHQWLYNVATKKKDIVIVDKGHFGGNVYPGVGKVRRGVEMYVKSVDYDKTRSTIITAS